MALSIQFNSDFLDIQKMSQSHKKTLENSISKLLLKERVDAVGKHLLIHARSDQPNPSLTVEGRAISLKGQDKATKAIQRIFQFYQHTGHLPRAGLPQADEEHLACIAKKTAQSIHDASIPGASRQVIAGMQVADDGLALTRNILYAIPTIGPQDPIINHLGYYAGMIWTCLAFRDLNQGMADHKQATLIGDGEGKRLSRVRITSGAICSAGAVSYLAGRVFDTLSLSPVSGALVDAATGLFGVSTVLSMGAFLVGICRCSEFNQSLNEYLNHPKLTEVEKLQGALRFLKEKISLSTAEKKELILQIQKDHPDLTIEEKEKLLSEKIADAIEVKVKYMKRRTSNKSLFLILTHADQLLAKLSDPKISDEAVKEATLLLAAIQKENRIKTVLYILSFIASLISFLALWVSTFFTAGLVPVILYGISGVIYLSLTVYSTTNLLMKRNLDYRKVNFNPVNSKLLTN